MLDACACKKEAVYEPMRDRARQGG